MNFQKRNFAYILLKTNTECSLKYQVQVFILQTNILLKNTKYMHLDYLSNSENVASMAAVFPVGLCMYTGLFEYELHTIEWSISLYIYQFHVVCISLLKIHVYVYNMYILYMLCLSIFLMKRHFFFAAMQTLIYN